jgi:hypothetical protein
MSGHEEALSEMDADEAREQARMWRSRWEASEKARREAEAIVRSATKLEGVPRPKRVKEPKAKGQKRATAVLLCSDWHVEKIVHASQVGGVNEHNPEVAKRRNAQLTEAWTWYLRAFARECIRVESAVIWLGGDMIENSDMPHIDSAEGCAMPPVQATRFAMELWERIIARTLDMGLPLHVVANDGNHGRMTAKTKHTNRVGHSIEHMAYHESARRMPEASWTIADGASEIVDIAGKRVRFQHGDTGGLRYQGGVGGLAVPYMRAYPRWDTIGRADIDGIAHWHSPQVIAGRGVVNGCVCGYDTFAQSIGAPYSPPTQMAFLVDREYGLSFDKRLELT